MIADIEEGDSASNVWAHPDLSPNGDTFVVGAGIHHAFPMSDKAALRSAASSGLSALDSWLASNAPADFLAWFRSLPANRAGSPPVHQPVQEEVRLAILG
jgi:hypothetical protein